MTTRLSQPVLALVCLAFAAATQAASPAVPDSLRSCMKEQDVLRRLSCYDSEMGRLASQSAPVPAAAASPAVAAPVAVAAAAAATAAPAAAEPARGRVSGFLRSLVPSKGKNPASVDAERSQLARISAVRQAANGLAVITLDNGQVWRQTEPEAYFPLDVGDTIRIEMGALGSYRLTRVEEGWKRFMRVALVSMGSGAPAASAPTAPVAAAPAPLAAPSAPPAPKAPIPAPVPAPTTAAAAAPAASGGGISGFASGLMQKIKPGSGGKAANAAENNQTARIAALQMTGAGMAVITLDNGQVWRQQETMSYFPLAVGDTIRIEPGALGSFRLTRIEEGWKTFMRVSRTK